MNIYYTPDGGKKIQFPWLPEKIEIGADAKFMTYDIISAGEVKIPRGKSTLEISWSGMFPGKARKKNRLVKKYANPDSLIKKFNKYRDSGTKGKLLISKTGINYIVYIESFKGQYSGGHGDFYYDIKFIVASEIKIYTTDEKKKGSSRKKSKSKSNKTKTNKKTWTYTVKRGDSLWKIAHKYLGKGSRYMEIYNLNKKKIKNPNLIYTGQKLVIPNE